MNIICYLLSQMTEPLETAELLAFARTVEVQSLSRAAIELGVPRATVGRRLARMEERLGVKLLKRTTRRMALTDAGEKLYRHASAVLEAVRAAEDSVRPADGKIHGELRVSLPPGFDDTLREVLMAFGAKHPALSLHVHVSTEHVDLAAGAYDVALRAGTSIAPGLIARTLRRMPMFCVASPAYLKEHGRPRTARDLAKHECLVMFSSREVPQTHWPAVRGARVRVRGPLATNDLRLIVTAARLGRGLAFVPQLLVEDELAAGTLERVLGGVIGAESQLAVVHADREFVRPAVRALVDALVAWGQDAAATKPRRC